ncbi:MAG: dihydroorotate dehydrogenase [Patescibacteria group bacterium]
MNTQINFLKKKFKNPLVLASGIRGLTGANMAKVIRDGGGGVTSKSASLEARTGHANPTMSGTEHYFINAVGFSNPGIGNVIEEIKTYKKLTNTPIIGSIFAGDIKGFGIIAKKMDKAPIDIMEVDISCPNVMQEFGEPLAFSAKAAAAVTKLVKKNTKKPITVKLSPGAWNIAEIAVSCEKAGADAITAVNTMPSIMISAKASRPVLTNGIGGMSGPALKPIALRCVWQIAQAVKIPIIGTGGITTGEDAIEMMMAGASLVGVGTAFYYRGPKTMKLINDEIKQFMKEEGIKDLKSIIKKAHV